MKLSQLFTGSLNTEETVHTAQTQSARNVADINRQIRSLIPGQTIRGEILSREGGEIQLRLSEDLILNARVDQSIHLEQGQSVTFEVKNNGSTLSLSPLFTNVASDVNILKALDMAGLPVNDTSVDMTKQLMEGGLPVNRSFLQQVYREINSFPEGEVTDVVGLHKLEMPVNQENMQQMASYRNLNYQLITGLNDILDNLPVAVNSMLEKGDIENAENLYRQLFRMAAEGDAFLPETTAEVEGESTEAMSVQTQNAAPDAVTDELLSGTETVRIPYDKTETEILILSPETRRALTDGLSQALNRLQLPTQDEEILTAQIQRLEQGEMSKTEFFDMAQKLLGASVKTRDGALILQNIFGGKEFRSVLTDRLISLWTLQPEEVAQQEKVENLYRRLDRQLKGLTRALESAGQQETSAYRAVTNVSKNVDFLNQINQMYTYVQLPLRLRETSTHGDLYVYTNKRSLAESDGKVSALLHLDMENLGPLDVYVTLQNEKVSTKFSVADEEILNFMEAHMDLLTERLQKRGYDCSYTVNVGNAGGRENSGGLGPLLGQDRGVMLSQYAFDVRT